MGRPAGWYVAIRAARYLGVPPWALLKEPLWLEYALAVMGLDQEQAEREMKRRKLRADHR